MINIPPVPFKLKDRVWWKPKRNSFVGLLAVLNGAEPVHSRRKVRDMWTVLDKLEVGLADKEEKPRQFRVVVQLQVIEQAAGSYGSDSQPVWTQRLLVIPVERVKAFDIQEVVESMVKETIEMTAT